MKKYRAFIIKVLDTNTYKDEKYLVIAESFAEAETLYHETIKEYFDIKSISEVEDIKNVAFPNIK